MNIRITDQLGERLQAYSAKNMRTANNSAEFLLDKVLSQIEAAQKIEKKSENFSGGRYNPMDDELPPELEKNNFEAQAPNIGGPSLACCGNKTPCKHWQWDANKEAWVNTLNGQTREATS